MSATVPQAMRRIARSAAEADATTAVYIEVEMRPVFVVRPVRTPRSIGGVEADLGDC